MNPLRTAHTLVELVLSMTVLTVVMAGTGSAIFLASRALPRDDDPLARLPRGADAMGRLADELSCAVSFTERLPTIVEFKVADRNKDGAEEVIRYEWSGTAGDALTRRYNAGTVVDLLKDVYALGFQYNTYSETSTQTVTEYVETGETLFAEFDGWTGLAPSPRDYPVSPTAWCSERFAIDLVTFPADADDIYLTRVQVRLKTAGGGASTTLGIYPPSASGGTEPSATPLGTPASLATSLLTATYDWKDFYYSDVNVTSQANEFILVIKGASPTSANVKYLYSLAAPSDAPVMRWTSNSGSSWSPTVASQLARQDISFRVYGRYKSSITSQQDQTRYWIRSVGLSLQVGSDASAMVRTEVQALNAPEVSAP